MEDPKKKEEVNKLTEKLEETKLDPESADSPKVEVEEETKGPKVPEEKKGGEEEVNLKHDALIEAKQDEFDEVEIIKGEGEQEALDKDYLLSLKHFNHASLNLRDEIIRALGEMGYHRTSKIQAVSIPYINKVPTKNVVAQAPTGTGKTFAFALGSLAKVEENEAAVQVIVLSPTRELSRQTYQVYQSLIKYTKIKLCLGLPGNNIRSEDLGHVLIGLPLTILKLTTKYKKEFPKVKVLVLDEADDLLAMKGLGHVENIIRLYKNINPLVQVLLFSATYSDKIKEQVFKVVKDPHQILMNPTKLSLKGVKQVYIKCEAREKPAKIHELFEKLTEITQSIVFVNTRKFADALKMYLQQHGHDGVDLLMGGTMEHKERDIVFDRFKQMKTRILITTDLLVRGIDNRKVTLVINVDIPCDPYNEFEPDYENYLRRVGRTGRFYDEGVVVNMVETYLDMKLLKKIEGFYQSTISELLDLDELQDELSKVRGDYYGIGEGGFGGGD